MKIGIDLGTTYSAAAYIKDGKPQPIANSEGENTTPSVVLFEDDGSVTVGSDAKERALIELENTVSTVKNHMGTPTEIIRRGKKYSPEDVSSMILKKILQDSRSALGEQIDGDTFGMEAVNTLVSEMENNRDNLVVILAGYSREMQKFIDTNPGIRSRVSRVIEFEDYTLENMTDIFALTMERKGYDISGLSREQVSGLIDQYCHEKDFGNGRGVRNLCDKIIRRHDNRLAAPDNLEKIDDRAFLTITAEDLNITGDSN